MDLADRFRYAPIPVAMFLIGLGALALVGARLIAMFWRAGLLARIGGVLAGAGLLTFLPQFFAPAPLRVAHGIALGAGLVALGIATVRNRR